MGHLPQITFNLILFSLLGGLSVLGFLFGENRLKSVSYGGFMAFFIIAVSSETAMSGVADKINAPIATAKITFVVVVCAASFLGSLISQRKSQGKLRSIPLAVVTTLFLCGFGLSLLNDSSRGRVVTDFNLAAQIYNLRFIFMGILAAWLVVTQFIPVKKDDDKK